MSNETSESDKQELRQLLETELESYKLVYALTKKQTELIKENKVLKRDLRRKDKALAETSALLILKKKAQEIWGTPEDEE